jgi:hypothetical protein
MLSWPKSHILVLLQSVDPSLISGDELESLQEGEAGLTLLHDLADLVDPSDYLTYENQQHPSNIEHGANANAVSSLGETPLHSACYSSVVTSQYLFAPPSTGCRSECPSTFGEDIVDVYHRFCSQCMLK